MSDVRPYDDCQLLTLTGLAPPDTGVERRILTPFDIVEPIERPRRLRTVRASLWRAAFRALAADDTPPGCLRSVRHADVDLMPHQLEPALAVLRGLGCRVLLADEVGLGKTIQAGILIAELRARGAADRVLVLTPAGLRDQWTRELSGRFDLDARVADAATLRRRAAEMPIGVNPWSIERVAVASLDYVKRAEVLPAVAAVAWDVVVVDEAHAAAGDSDRRGAVAALATRAAFVVLVTATPHSGDRQSFSSLTGLGRAADDEPLLVFRRTRSEVRSGPRRHVHALHVQPTAAETHLHALLWQYTTALLAERDDAWLPASVLNKRAFSSAWSLAQSVERRLNALTYGDSAPPRDDVEQLTLPLEDRDGEETTADEAPAWPAQLGLANAAQEVRLLRDVLATARHAARTESKLSAIRRILRRVNEPAIVFTEFRDTLQHLQHALRRPAAVLHGGLTREQRSAALQDFSTGRHTLLLATDAAGEGLNLHDSCRIVINLELPWNPMRLEQRIGRVDRIGQRRAVHAWHLVGAGETPVLERLKSRIEQARDDIGASDPFGDDEERAVARAVVCDFGETSVTARPESLEGRADARGSASFPRAAWPTGQPLTLPDLSDVAGTEAHRLTFSRSMSRTPSRADMISPGHVERVRLSLEGDGAWVYRTRNAATRAKLGQRILLLWRVGFEDGCGRTVESSCVGVEVRIVSGERQPMQRVRDRACLLPLLASVERDILPLLEAAATPWREAAGRVTDAFASARLRRERAVATRRTTLAPAAFQPGLFDRRAERQHVEATIERARTERELTSRFERIVAASDLRAAAPRLLLVLVP